MRDTRAVHGAGVVLGDATNHNAVGTRSASVVHSTILKDRELQVGGLAVGKVKVLVYIGARQWHVRQEDVWWL